MRNIIMKRALFFGIISLVLLSMNACTSVSMSTTPHFYTSTTTAGFEVLGEVIYESADKTGFIELLRAARRLYPDCDYVIDIMIDRKDTSITSSSGEKRTVKSTTWVMRGTAIKYKK